jgi:hypothetical protein
MWGNILNHMSPYVVIYLILTKNSYSFHALQESNIKIRIFLDQRISIFSSHRFYFLVKINKKYFLEYRIFFSFFFVSTFDFNIE